VNFHSSARWACCALRELLQADMAAVGITPSGTLVAEELGQTFGLL